MRNLPAEQVVALRRAFKTAKKGREKVRYHALWLLTQGYTRRQVCQIIAVSARTLGDWVTKYYRKGLEGLKSKPQLGNNRQLTNEQKKKIKDLITKHSPQELGLEGRFWNRVLLKQLVKKQFGVVYQHWESYRRLFKWCNFTFHQPNKVNQKRDSHMVKRFEDQLKKGSGSTKEKITWYW